MRCFQEWRHAGLCLVSLTFLWREDRRDKAPHHHMYACARHLRTKKIIIIIYSITKPVDSYGRSKKIYIYIYRYFLSCTS